MAPTSTITTQPSVKRKITSRDEILQKWRKDKYFKADEEYRKKCQMNNSDAEEDIVDSSVTGQRPCDTSSSPRNSIIKRSRKSSSVNGALKLVIQECIGRIDKIDNDFQKYKRSNSIDYTSEKLPRGNNKPCCTCKCTCISNKNPSEAKENIQKEVSSPNTDINSISMRDRQIYPDISNVGIENYLIGSTEKQKSLSHKLEATSHTPLSTILSVTKTSNKASSTPKTEINGARPTIDVLSCTTPVADKTISDIKSKAKESWFDASIQDFENSPDVQRGRPSLHILKDRRIVQSLTKQFL